MDIAAVQVAADLMKDFTLPEDRATPDDDGVRVADITATGANVDDPCLEVGELLDLVAQCDRSRPFKFNAGCSIWRRTRCLRFRSALSGVSIQALEVDEESPTVSIGVFPAGRHRSWIREGPTERATECCLDVATRRARYV